MDKQIILVGLNHRTASVDVREKFALTNVENFEQGLLAACPLREVLALSTCNRVEVLVVADGERAAGQDLADAVLRHWAMELRQIRWDWDEPFGEPVSSVCPPPPHFDRPMATQSRRFRAPTKKAPHPKGEAEPF